MHLRFGRHVGLVLVGLVACRDDGKGEAGDAMVAVSSVEVPTTTARLAPLRGEWMEKIELPDGGLAYVAPPVGATEARPVVVAVHGAIDDAGLMCSAWRLVADVYPFVVCPAGTTIRKDTYVWGSSDQIRKRVNEAIAAVRSRYGEHVARGPAVYAAFSQGANMAGPVLEKSAKLTPRAILSEGGYRAFDRAGSASAFARNGGERVMFSCSQPGCARWFDAPRAALERGGVPVSVVDCGPHGHSMPPPVRERLNAVLPWLVEGMPGWEGYASAPKLASH
jgi:hypothetical protein